MYFICFNIATFINRSVTTVSTIVMVKSLATKGTALGDKNEPGTSRIQMSTLDYHYHLKTAISKSAYSVYETEVSMKIWCSTVDQCKFAFLPKKNCTCWRNVWLTFRSLVLFSLDNFPWTTALIIRDGGITGYYRVTTPWPLISRL